MSDQSALPASDLEGSGRRSSAEEARALIHNDYDGCDDDDTTDQAIKLARDRPSAPRPREIIVRN